jgi:hypothetical protein
MSERMMRGRVELACLNDGELDHVMDDRAKVRAFSRALRNGASLPPLFVVHLRGELLLFHGLEQTAAADKVGVEELDAIVFNAADLGEADEVGAVGFDLAECGCDVWSGLQLMGRRAEACAAA